MLFKNLFQLYLDNFQNNYFLLSDKLEHNYTVISIIKFIRSLLISNSLSVRDMSL